mgnify:FL=1
MSVSFNKTGVITVSGSSSGVLTSLIEESGNYLVDQSGNYLVSDASWDEWGYAHGFVEGEELMSIYESTVTTREFIEW